MSDIARVVHERFPHWVIASHAYRGDQTVILKREGLLEVCAALRDAPEFAFEFLMDLGCVDYLSFGSFQGSAPTLKTPSPLPYFMKPKPTTETWERGVPNEFRFEVVYHFFSTAHKHRLRLVVPVEESDAEVDSLASLWPGANWLEREVWDMFGVRFRGHPDLKRILMYEGFEGHPLRKDYPVKKRQPLIGPIN